MEQHVAASALKLLIVEDNIKVRRMIRRIVEEVVAEVNECADGSEALAAYGRFHPDWVLMDIRMQEVDGITATKHLKQSFPEAKILIVTDYDDDDLRESARRVGAEGYVIKENLVVLRRLLER